MPTLTAIRDALGFTRDEVLAATGWPPERLAAIERDDDLDETEERSLGDLYGVDISEALAAENPRVPPIAALLKGEAQHLSAPARFAMAEAVSVALTIRALQARLDLPGDGAARALGHEPMGTAQDQPAEPLDVLVLVADLPENVDAFSLDAPETGRLFVLNRARHPEIRLARSSLPRTHAMCSATVCRIFTEPGFRLDPAPTLDPCALAGGVSPLRAGCLLDWLLAAYMVGAVSESYVREGLRLSWATWRPLRGALDPRLGGAGPAGGLNLLSTHHPL